MPREHVYGEDVTVTDGELAVLAARRPDQLPAPATAPDDRASRLESFVAAVRVALDGFSRPHGELRAVIRDHLADLDSPPDRPPTAVEVQLGGDLVSVAPGGRRVVRTSSTDAVRPPDEPVVVRRRATLAWSRDAGLVTLRVDGYHPGNADRPPGDVDLGGLLLPLDWSGCNRLARRLKVARDQSWGVPE